MLIEPQQLEKPEMKNLKQKIAAASVVAAGALAAINAHAVSVVTTGVTDQLADAQTDVITVGGAILAVLVVVAAFRLVRRSM